MKDIKGFEGLYAVTKDGRVWSYPYKKGGSKKGKWLKAFVHRKGYLNYYLQNDYKRKIIFAHTLVGQAFLPNPLCLKEINHKNANKKDNRVGNLEWSSRLHNMRHAYKLNLVPILRGEKHGASKLTEKQVLAIRSIYSYGLMSQTAIANILQLHKSTIAYLISRKTWKHI